MIERGVRSIELEELQSVGGGARTQIKALAKNYYVQGASAAQELDQTLREGRTISFKQAKRAIQNIVDLMQNDESILLGLTTLRCHDEYTHNHSVNVSILSIALANRAGYPKADLSELGLAALFHDVGKSCIPLQVLNKPGEFSDEEWQLMRSHPIEGVLTMIALRGISNVSGRLAAASFEHHMNCNLSGYPKLSVPWNQSLTARVVTIADCYDAMTSSRVYRRQPMPPEKVLKIMLSKSGEAFDPVLLKLFINCVGIVPIGSLVLLDSHELAVVIRTNQTGSGDRPWVKLISDVQGDAIDGPEVNLADLDDQGRYRLSIQRLVDHTEYGINPSQFFV
jgi:HD-GYP domain-containing protein (c-di-GMP phosphodiesterase class II)